MRQSTIDKIYKKTRKKYPDIKSETTIEKIVRKRIFRRKIFLVFSLYALSILVGILLGNGTIDTLLKDLDAETHETIKAVFEVIYGGSAIAAVMIFAKSLHDPLTPNESRELQEKETYEKTGHK